jgi:hypothetical protein
VGKQDKQDRCSAAAGFVGYFFRIAGDYSFILHILPQLCCDLAYPVSYQEKASLCWE